MSQSTIVHMLLLAVLSASVGCLLGIDDREIQNSIQTPPSNSMPGRSKH